MLYSVMSIKVELILTSKHVYAERFNLNEFVKKESYSVKVKVAESCDREEAEKEEETETSCPS